MAAEVAIRITADGKAVVTAAKQAEVALEGIGAQADKTAARLKGATQSSEGLDAAMQKMGKPGPTGGLSSYVADLDKVGISAKQTANALRGVPAQFTDIVTSLQGGQAPLTVFLQQGGQLKDMFGGAGNAARALGGYVMGLVNPFTVGAAVVGGIAFAYEQGARESRSFQNATTMSGNAVGLSSSQFGAMTQSLSAMAGTRGKAVEALTEIASTGKLAGAEIKNIAEAAILMEKATGQAIDETVAQFVKLADAPAKAVLELNKSYNFLTAAVYSQIKALEEQGNKLGAAELAEKTYADALKARASTVIDNAGLMERAWRGITGAAKGAWDAMLGVGRQASLADKLAAVSAEIAKAQGPFNASAFGDGNAEARAKLPANLALQANLQEMVRLEQRGTEAAAQRNQVQLAGIAGIDAVARANEKAASKQDQMNKALKDYHDGIAAMKAAGASGVPDAKKIADTEAAIRAQYKETAKVASTAGQSEVARIQARVIETESYIQSLKTQGVAAKELNEGEKLAIKIQKELEGGLKGVALANKQKALTAAESLAAVLRESDALKASLKSQREFETLRDKEISGQESSILKLEEKALAMEDEVRMYGLGKQAIEVLSIARLQERIDILEGFSNSAEQIALIEKEIDARKRLAVATDAKAGLDAGVKAAKETDAEWKRTATSIENTLTESLMRSFEKGQSFAKTARDTIVNMFKTMVLRPIVSAIMAPISGAVGGALGLLGTANAASGGSNLLGMASNASSLYSATSSMVTLGSQVVAGTMSVANALGTVAANATGTGISGLLAANGAYGTAAAGSASAMAGGATAALAAIPVWGWAALAAVAVASIFGGRGDKEATGGGIEGNFGSTGFAGNTFSTWAQDGGWFHNDRTGKDTGNLDAATTQKFSDSYAAVKTAAAQAAVALGLSAGAITNYSQDISLQLGSDAAANENAVAALFAGIGDNMATAVAPGLAALAKEGESAGTTLSRLAGSLGAANAWLDVLGQTLVDVSLAGGDTASKLADAFGSLDNMATASKSFYETYYTEGERAARSQQDLTRALGQFGIALPTSKDAFRDVATSLDLTTEAGRQAYAAMLLLAPEFAATADSLATSAKEAMESLFGGVVQGIKTALDSIASERAAVQSAMLQINDPGVMSRDAILRGIAGAAISMPGSAGVAAASADLAGKDHSYAAAAAANDAAIAIGQAAVSSAQSILDGSIAKYQSLASQFQAGAGGYAVGVGNAYGYNSSTNQLNSWDGSTEDKTTSGRAYRHFMEDSQRFREAFGAISGVLAGGNDVLAAQKDAVDRAKAVSETAISSAKQVAEATMAAVKAAEETLRAEVSAYAGAMQDFAIDATKAAAKLGTLREETLKYYDAQKALAGLMTTSAAGLRESVRVTRMSQMDAKQSLAQKQADFSSNYSMSLATTGATQAGYADKLAAALPDLSAALMDTASTRAEWALSTGRLMAQSDSVAALLEANAPQDHAADSLAMLGQIDAALAVLDASSKSAEKIVADAVTAGSNKTADGLRAVIAALTGQTVPAFATGGAFTNGVVSRPTAFNMGVMGEGGQSEAIMPLANIGGKLGVRTVGAGAARMDTARLEALVGRLVEDNVNMRAELRAIATHSAKTARVLTRVTRDGEALQTVAAE